MRGVGERKGFGVKCKGVGGSGVRKEGVKEVEEG